MITQCLKIGFSLLSRLQSLYTLKYALIGAAYLVPNDAKYHQVITEGIFSLSRMLAIIETKSSISQSKVAHWLLHLTYFLSSVELFCEKLLHSLAAGESSQQIIYTLLETIKGISRLSLLFLLKDKEGISNPSIILLQWGQGVQEPSDLMTRATHTSLESFLIEMEIHYRRRFYFLARQSVPVSPTPPSRQFKASTNLYVGRRSGLRLETNREHLGIEYGGEVLSPSPIAKRLGDSLSSEDFTTVSTPLSSSVSDMGLETAPAHLPMAAPPKMQDWTTVLTPSQCLVAGEVLYVLRPMAYMWTRQWLSKRSIDAQSSKDASATSAEVQKAQDVLLRGALALLVSLVVEVLSIQLTMHAVYIATRKLQEQLAQEFHVEAGAREGVLPFEEAVTQWPRQLKTLPVWPRNTTTPVLLLEIRRRKYALLLNLLRSPLFDSATLPALKHLSHLFEHVPVLRSIPSYCINFATYMNQYYFNHSGSS